MKTPPLSYPSPSSVIGDRRSFAAIWIQRAIIVLLLALSAWQMGKQLPPIRTDSFLWDFSNAYCESRALLLGRDPYQVQNVDQVWDQVPHSRYFAPENRGWLWVWLSVNSPPSLAMLEPLAALTPAASHIVWVVMEIVLFILVCLALWELGGLKTADDRLLLVACLLAAASVVDGFQSGQLGLPACAGVILAVWAIHRDKPILAGIILGLATAVKMQVAGPFIIYYLLIRRGRLAGVALAVFATISLIGIAQLQMHHVPWLHEWMANAADSLRPGKGNDPRPGALFRDDLINVQTWLYGLMSSDAMVRNLAIVCFVIPAAVFLVGLRRSDRRVDDLLALSCIALLSFLPVYRRLYDTTVLAFLVTWAIGALRTNKRVVAMVTLVLLAQLVLPVETVPMILRHAGGLYRYADTRFWQTMVVPHHAWAIVVLTVWTIGLYWMLNRRSRAGEESGGLAARLSSPHSAI